MLKPRKPVPALEFDTVGGEHGSLAAQNPQNFTMFDKRGVSTVVTSTDPRERAAEAREKWGLYISSSRGMTSAGVEEPPLFAEPGLFLVKPDGTLYWSNVSTMPFARPHFNEISAAIDFALSKNYPARGEA